MHSILLPCLLGTAAVALRAEQPPIRSYTTADGLASDWVTGVLADSRGFIWLRTNEGVSRFDGYAFANYTTRDGLPDLRGRDLHETQDGTVWVATAKGLSRFDPRASAATPLFVVERLGEDAKANEVNALLEARDGTLWCGTAGGLFRLTRRDGRWTASRVEIGTSEEVRSLAEDRWGGVWVGTLGEMRLLRPDGRVEVHALPGVNSNSPVRAALADASGRIWVGTRNGVCRSAPRPSADTPVEISQVGGTAFGWGLGFLQLRSGTLWVAATSGLFRLEGAEGEAWERVDAIDERCDKGAIDIAEDRDGNLWLATPCGALRVDRSGFTGYSSADGLESRYINSIFESNAGDLVIETVENSERVLHRLEGGTFASVVANLPEAENMVAWGAGQTVIQDREGAWWVPASTGLYRFPKAERPEDPLRARPEPIYTEHEVSHVFEDSRGDIWFSAGGPDGRLLRWEHATRRVADLTAETGIASPIVYFSFAETRGGTIWIGTGRGDLLRHTAAGFIRLGAGDGVPAGSLRALYVDDAGRLWIASFGGGLARVDDPSAARPRFVSYTTAEGLASANVTFVIGDAWGRIYASTSRGIDRIDLATGRVKHFTATDGLPRGNTLAAFRDRSGALWFGSMFGLVRFDPEPRREREPPRTLVTGLRVAGVARPVAAVGEMTLAPLDLGAGENSVSLDFVGLGPSLGEELHYQYSLEGAGGDWSAPAPERTVTLARLGAGSYRFRVRAIDADGVASPEPASVAFTIAPPLWQRWWFLTLAAGLVGLAAYGGYRNRVRRLLEIERMRTRIASDLHDDIGASLSRIAILSEIAKLQAGAVPVRYLDEIGEEARGLVDSMSDIVWAINPRADNLASLVARLRKFAGGLLEPLGVALVLDAPQEAAVIVLAPELRRHLYAILKEAVANIARHAGARQARLSLALERGRLLAEVSDDGRGFSPASTEEADEQGNGLRNIRRRAAVLGGELRIESRHGEGARLRLDIPLSPPGRSA